MIRHDGHAYVLKTEQHFEQSPEELFSLFAQAENLARITPAWLDFQILTPRPIEMKAGTLIDYRLKLHRIPLRWRTKITAWEPPYRFVDEQIKGPYRFWIHQHILEPHEDGTLMRDRVTFLSRGPGLLLPLLHKLFVNRNVREVFEYRRAKLRDMLRPAEAAAA